jgi:hypothetical protein
MATALLRTEMDVEIPIDVLYYLPMWGPDLVAVTKSVGVLVLDHVNRRML